MSTENFPRWLATQEQSAATSPPVDLEQELFDILKEEMAAELILESDPAASNDDINKAIAASKGNPADAVILYEMMKLMKP